VDETYLKVHGKWCYLFRAFDHDGNLVDVRLSEKRDMDAAKRFFLQRLVALKALIQAPSQRETSRNKHAMEPWQASVFSVLTLPLLQSARHSSSLLARIGEKRYAIQEDDG